MTLGTTPSLMRAVAEAVADCESEEIAGANGRAVLRTRLGWTTDREARADVLSHFAAVAQAVFQSFVASDDTVAGVQDALSESETWNAASHATPFGVLFEHTVSETPLVDF